MTPRKSAYRKTPWPRDLCLLKSPFLLLRLMWQRIVDTLLDDDVRPPVLRQNVIASPAG